MSIADKVRELELQRNEALERVRKLEARFKDSWRDALVQQRDELRARVRELETMAPLGGEVKAARERIREMEEGRASGLQERKELKERIRSLESARGFVMADNEKLRERVYELELVRDPDAHKTIKQLRERGRKLEGIVDRDEKAVATLRRTIRELIHTNSELCEDCAHKCASEELRERIRELERTEKWVLGANRELEKENKELHDLKIKYSRLEQVVVTILNTMPDGLILPMGTELSPGLGLALHDARKILGCVTGSPDPKHRRKIMKEPLRFFEWHPWREDTNEELKARYSRLEQAVIAILDAVGDEALGGFIRSLPYAANLHLALHDARKLIGYVGGDDAQDFEQDGVHTCEEEVAKHRQLVAAAREVAKKGSVSLDEKLAQIEVLAEALRDLKAPQYHNPCEKADGCKQCGCVYNPDEYEAECPHRPKWVRELDGEKP